MSVFVETQWKKHWEPQIVLYFSKSMHEFAYKYFLNDDDCQTERMLAAALKIVFWAVDAL